MEITSEEFERLKSCLEAGKGVGRIEGSGLELGGETETGAMAATLEGCGGAEGTGEMTGEMGTKEGGAMGPVRDGGVAEATDAPGVDILTGETLGGEGKVELSGMGFTVGGARG